MENLEKNEQVNNNQDSFDELLQKDQSFLDNLIGNNIYIEKSYKDNDPQYAELTRKGIRLYKKIHFDIVDSMINDTDIDAIVDSSKDLIRILKSDDRFDDQLEPLVQKMQVIFDTLPEEHLKDL